MDKILSILSGKKTYLMLLVYVLLVLTNNLSGTEINFDSAKLQEVVLAGALATLRAGVSKIGGGT